MSNFMENKDSLAKKASYLRIAAAELAEGMKEGNFRSLYRGQGIEFSGVRDYIRGDDIRAIDWNVTARMGRPYIKVFEEERELQIFLIVDTSLSMQLGSGKRTKFNSVAESIALLSMAAEMNSCPLGAVFFDGEIQFSCAPEHGRERTMVILKQLEDLPQKLQEITLSLLAIFLRYLCSITLSIRPYSQASCADRKLSRSVSAVTFSSVWPVLSARIVLSFSFIFIILSA
jgi:uncharacterized protein (DUF58 family)